MLSPGNVRALLKGAIETKPREKSSRLQHHHDHIPPQNVIFTLVTLHRDQKILMCSMSFSGVYFVYSTANSVNTPECASSNPRPCKIQTKRQKRQKCNQNQQKISKIKAKKTKNMSTPNQRKAYTQPTITA